MSFSLKRKAVMLFNNPDAPKSINRHNATQWLKAIRFLGNNWVCAIPIQKQK